MAATVWVKPLNDFWQPIGTVRDAGVWHENLVAISDQFGPKSATFVLKRQRRAGVPDLLTQTPVIIEEGGVKVWRGRVKDTPEQGGASRQIDVECEGGQYLLDDDALERVLVHTDLTAWKDLRSFLGITLGNDFAGSVQKCYAAGSVSSDSGIQLQMPQGSAVGALARVGVMVDLGPGNAAKRIVAAYTQSNNDAAVQFVLSGADSQAEMQSATGGYENLVAFANNSGASGTTAATFSTARRYVSLYIRDTGSGHTPTADVWMRFSSVQLFADTAYESGNTSILDAGTIIRDTLTRTNLATALHPDWTGIGSPTFSFPNFAPDSPKTPRELITAANAPHGWRLKIDENLKPLYRALASVPVIDLGAWLGSESDSGSSNSDEGIVTKAIVIGVGPDGLPVRSTGSQSGTIVDRQGGVRAKALTTNYKLNSTLADKLRDAYLASHRTSPFKGQNVVTYGGARRTDSGQPVRPAHLLLLTSELARRTDLVDPDTGALGRTAVIDQVTYRDDDQSAEVDLDNTRRDFEALQERLGLLVPA